MSIGASQIVLILLIVLIIFGAGRLPSVMGELGRGIKNFKKEVKSPEDKTPNS
ncbi:twin-arginine translocase TatA/TatE family subunit [Anaplasmataceae bacterium AB001_6]|nr:twin-arginine translocase TatA/TatE family subunit [Anaplasmataceae bacterium AB001_6]